VVFPINTFVNYGLTMYQLDYTYSDVAPEMIWIAWIMLPVVFIVTIPMIRIMRRVTHNSRAAGAATTNATTPRGDRTSRSTAAKSSPNRYRSVFDTRPLDQSGRTRLLIYGSIFVPKTSRNFASHVGCAGHAGAVTNFPSATASAIPIFA